MPSFDLDAYLASRTNASQKLQDLEQASQEKQTELGAMADVLQRRAAERESYKKSWAGKLGLAEGGLASDVTNLGASLVSGGSRLAGQLASLPLSVDGAFDTDPLNEEDYQAYNRVQTNKATPEDLQRLNQAYSDGSTVQQRLEHANLRRGQARQVNDLFNLDNIVAQTNRNGLAQDLASDFQPNWDKVKSGDAGQVVSGLAGLLVNAGGAILNNKKAVLEYIVENAPQLAIGMLPGGQALMGASNIGYAVDNYQQGVEAYQKAHGGQLPPEEWRKEKALQAASLALAEHAGDSAAHAFGKVAKAGTEAANDAVRTGFKQSLKNTAKAAGEGVLTEAPTEGYQTYMEGEVTGKPATALDVYTGTVIGGASGAGLTGGMRGLAKATKSTPEHVEQRAADLQKTLDKAKTKVDAIKTGDVSAFTDPKSQHYAPDEAITALFGNSRQEGTTDEAKQANLKKASDIVLDLQTRRDELAKDVASPEERQAQIAALEAKKAAYAAKNPDKTDNLSLFDDAIADLKKPIDPAEAKAKTEQLAVVDKQLERAQRAHNALTQLVQPKTPEAPAKAAVQALVAAATDATEGVDRATPAKKLVNLAMQSPDSLDHETAAKLAADTTNGLSDSERGFLRSFTEARIAVNKLKEMDQVSRDIVEGSKKDAPIKFVGLKEYGEKFAKAIARGDQGQAKSLIRGVSNFLQSHEGKAAAAAKAFAMGKGTQIQHRSGKWVVVARDSKEALSPAALRENGGLAMNSEALVKRIQEEASAISTVAQHLQAAHDIAFSKTGNTQTNASTEGASNVQDVSQQGTQPQPKPQAAPVQDRPQAGKGSEQGSQGASTTAGTPGNVEAARVAAQKDPVVTRNSQPAPGVSWAPQVTLDYGSYTIHNDGTDPHYSLKKPVAIAPNVSVSAFTIQKQGTELQIQAENSKGEKLVFLVSGYSIDVEHKPSGKFVRYVFGKERNKSIDEAFGTDLVAAMEKAAPAERAGMAADMVAQKAGVVGIERFAQEFDDMRQERPIGTTYAGTANVEGAGVTGTVSLDTDEIYKAWSNVGDGSDRASMRDQMAYVDKNYKGKVTEANREDVRKELRTQFKWFRLASKEQQTAALDSLVAAKDIKFTEIKPGSAEDKAVSPQSTVGISDESRADLGLPANDTYENAVKVVTGPGGKGSVSLVQRSLGIGYNKAAEYLERMEKDGIVGPMQANGQREVLASSASSRGEGGSQVAESSQATQRDSVSSVVSAEQSTEKAQSTQVAQSTQETQSTESAQSTPVDSKASSVDQSTAENTTATAGDTQQGESKPVEDSTEGEEDSTGSPDSGESGRLSAFAQKSPTGTSYTERNLISDFFSQVAKWTGLKSVRPLVAVKDFLSRWTAGEISPENFIALEQGQSLSEEQVRALEHLRKTLAAWNGKIQGNLDLNDDSNGEFASKDMLRFLVTKDGKKLDLEENVKTAMSFAAYQYLAMKVSGPQKLDKDQILSMHGKPKGSYLSRDGESTLNKAMGHEDKVISELGKAVVRALGIQATEDAPLDLMPHLESAFGARVLALMEGEDLIDRGFIPTVEVDSFFKDGGEFPQDEDAGDSDAVEAKQGEAKKPGVGTPMTTYIFLARMEGPKNPLTKPLVAIKEANAKTYDVINKLFDQEQAPRFAETKPVKFTQKFTKRTRQLISKMQRRVIQRTMDTPHKVIPEMLAFSMALGEEAMLKIAGWVDLEGTKYHLSEIEGIDAQNQNLENQFRLMMEMLENPANPDGFDTEFFIRQEVWKNTRAGITTQSLNTQTSKIHRYMFARPAWNTTLDLGNKNMILAFKVAMAQAIGINIDRQVNAKTLEILDEKLADGTDLMQAIEAIRRTVESPDGIQLTDEEKALITKVSADAEGMQTFQALVAYAKYENARQAGKDKVAITMLVGADGKTSGPMLTHLALGAATTADQLYRTLERGGMYSNREGSAKHFSEWYSRAGSRDLYENLTGLASTVAESYLSTIEHIRDLHKKKEHKEAFKLFTIEQWESFESITKELVEGKTNKITKAGRNLTKTPLTAFGFGSSLFSAVRGMENKFIADLYGTISAMAQGKRDDLSIHDFLSGVNELIAMGDRPVRDERTGEMIRLPLLRMQPIERLLELEFSDGQEKAIRAAFQRIMGNPVKEAMKQEFGVFVQRRTDLNKTIQAGYVTYQTIYANARIKHIEELVANGEIASRTVRTGKDAGKKTPLHDMSAKQEKAFREKYQGLLPVVHTDYSLAENDPDGGLYMAKLKSRPQTTPLYSSEIRVRNKTTASNKYPTNIFKVNPMVTQEQDPGLAGVPYEIHSIDSAGMHGALDMLPEIDGHNVHDEIGTGVDKIEAAAGAINQAILNTLLGYSPAAESFAMFKRVVLGAAHLVKEGDADRGTVLSIFQQWADLYNRDQQGPDGVPIPVDMAPQVVLKMAFWNAVEADRVRLDAIAHMGVMDQYPWEGGSFTVTQEIRDEAAKRLKELPTEIPKELQEAVEYLESLHEDKSTKPVITPEWATPEVKEEEPERAEPVEPAKPAGQKAGENHWGVLRQEGDPVKQTNEPLVTWLEAHPKTTAGELLNFLKGLLNDAEFSGAEGQWKDFNAQLLLQLYRSVDKNLPVTYVRADTPFNEAISMEGLDNASGWFNREGHGIFLLSPDYKHSNLKTQIVMHEVVHGVLADLVEAAQDGVAPKEVEALVSQLEDLYGEAKAFAAKDPELAKKYAYPLSNIHEFLAYGLTNRSFQKEILGGFKSKTKRLQSNSLVSAMQDFVKIVAGLLFHDRPKADQLKAISGMDVFIANTSGLIEAAAQQQEKQGKVEAKTGSKPNLAMQDAPEEEELQAIDHYTTQDIYEALDNGSVSPGFSENLQGLLSSIVRKLHGPFGSFKEAMRKTEAPNPMAVWLKALETGKAPFASQVVASVLASSTQQDFVVEQVEATVRAALNANEAQSTMAYRQLAKLYTEAEKLVKPSDFTGNAALQQEKYDFIFKVEKSGGRGDHSDYLARFAALGLANEEFNTLLKVATQRQDKKLSDMKSFGDKIQAVFERILAFFQEKVTHTYKGQPADQKLTALVDQLVDIEAKRRYALGLRAKSRIGNATDKVEGMAKDLVEKAKEKVVAAATSDFVRKSARGVLKGAGAIAHVVAGNHVDAALRQLDRLRDDMAAGQEGILAGLVREIRGPAEGFRKMLLVTKENERRRQKASDNIAKFSLEAFEEGEDFSKEQEAALTAVFLRSGAHALVGDYTMAQLEELLSNPQALKDAIGVLEDQLSSTPFKDAWLWRAKDLAYHKVTDINRSKALMLNAHNIVGMVGYAKSVMDMVSDAQKRSSVPVVEKLIALYTLQYSEQADVDAAKAILHTENARTDGGHGVEYLLGLHKHLEADARERNFHGRPELMIHGYTPEIYNPYTDVRVASGQEGADLENQGYARGSRVSVDPQDPDQSPRYFYVLKDGGLTPYVSGIVSNSHTQAKGTAKHSGYLNPRTEDGAENSQVNAAILSGRGNFNKTVSGVAYDPRQAKGEYLAPVVNENGQIVNWRYMMRRSTKDAVLERDNRFSVVLGRLAGSTLDKQTSQEQNRKVIASLHTIWQGDFAERANGYLEIGPESEDTQLRELWALLPRDTKEAVKSIWGDKKMYVHRDSLDIVFGYRKLSAATRFKKANAERNAKASRGLDSDLHSLKSIDAVDKIIVYTVESGLTLYARTRGMSQADAEKYSRRAAVLVTRGERIWQELVRETKDLIVVKSIKVLKDNILSNVSQLWLQGVPWKDMAHHHLVALKGATAYMKDSEDLERLRTQLAAGQAKGNEAQVRREILKLEDAIARNPVTELVNAGLMPTIVEDLGNEDQYSYKSALFKKTAAITDQINPTVLKTVRTAYLAHDTALYQVLSRVTQLSDFVARYTLYQHLIHRAADPLTKEQALLRASDAFVNYDAPMQRTLQYSDDMGFTYFTKYFLRMQRVLLKIEQENPARVLSLIALNQFMNTGPNVLDTSALKHLGNNPFELGAFKMLPAMADLPSVVAPMALLQ